MQALTVAVLALFVAYVAAQTASGTVNSGDPSCAGQCGSQETGCSTAQGCGCCPYPKGDCCKDHAHCCPGGYGCDIPDQQCIQKKGAFGNNFFMPKVIPAAKIRV
jgi:hypothetical protein